MRSQTDAGRQGIDMNWYQSRQREGERGKMSWFLHLGGYAISKLLGWGP